MQKKLLFFITIFWIYLSCQSADNQPFELAEKDFFSNHFADESNSTLALLTFVPNTEKNILLSATDRIKVHCLDEEDILPVEFSHRPHYSKKNPRKAPITSIVFNHKNNLIAVADKEMIHIYSFQEPYDQSDSLLYEIQDTGSITFDNENNLFDRKNNLLVTKKCSINTYYFSNEYQSSVQTESNPKTISSLYNELAPYAHYIPQDSKLFIHNYNTKLPQCIDLKDLKNCKIISIELSPKREHILLTGQESIHVYTIGTTDLPNYNTINFNFSGSCAFYPKNNNIIFMLHHDTGSLTAFDLKTKKEIYHQILLKSPLKPNFNPDNLTHYKRLAFNANGTLLAIALDWLFKIFELPEKLVNFLTTYDAQSDSIPNNTNINNELPNEQLNGAPVIQDTRTRDSSNKEKIIHKSFFAKHKQTIILCSLVGIIGILSAAFIRAYLHYR